MATKSTVRNRLRQYVIELQDFESLKQAMVIVYRYMLNDWFFKRLNPYIKEFLPGRHSYYEFSYEKLDEHRAKIDFQFGNLFK